jgi:pyruvate formate lyase activating enzyme
MERTAPAILSEPLPGAARCSACAHRCVVTPDAPGKCGVRFYANGALRAPRGYVAARHVRSVETHTLYHVRPGAKALGFGMLGCDLHCAYCHNARISQTWRGGKNVAIDSVSAEGLVAAALEAGCEVVSAAYNEPMVTAEWAHEVFTAAKAQGLVTAMVSDGHTTPEALAYLRPVLDVYRVDLKGFDASHYRALGGRLGAVVEGIARAHALGYWVEVVTLVVPGFNDDLLGLRGLARTLADIDPNIPWHLNGFVPRHRMRATPAATPLLPTLVAGSAYAQGLRYVYVGNFGAGPSGLADTRCPTCRMAVVERQDYTTVAVAVQDGGCMGCGAPIPGLWGPRYGRAAASQAARLATPMARSSVTG